MDGRLRKEDWVVRCVSPRTAYALVRKYHYAKSATKTYVYIHGLFRRGEEYPESKCVGVAWWLPPTKLAAINTYPEGDWHKVLSLTRLVIHPDVPKNACSFLLGQSMKLINQTTWECLVTYADTWQNHTGAIYKATNWEYCGLTKPTAVYVKDGMMMGKKRGDKNYTVEQMKQLGFENLGSYPKHKFRFILPQTKRRDTIKRKQQELFT